MAKWAAAVPQKKRPLKAGDKICCRHFLESDIEKLWEHKINGETTQMVRDRPRLKKNVVPHRNLHIVLGEKKKKSEKRKADEQRKEALVKKIKAGMVHEEVIEELIVPDTNSLIEYDTNVEATEEIFIEVEVAEVPNEAIPKKTNPDKRWSVRKVPPKKSDEKKREDFESLYEEVFAVQLPSQLWGIHRCPDMKFMAFSRFDAETINSCDLVVHINDVWKYTVSFKGVDVKEDYLSIMTEDSITVLLDEIDSTRYILKDTGEVVVKRKYKKQQ